MMFLTTSSPKHVFVLIQMQMRDEVTQTVCSVRITAGCLWNGLHLQVKMITQAVQSFNLFF